MVYNAVGRSRLFTALLAGLPPLLVIGYAQAQTPDPAGATASPTSSSEAPTTPRIDLAFCIDTSGSMVGGMPRAKQAIAAIIARTAAENPGATIRCGLMRYGDGDRQYYVLPLSDNTNRFFTALEQTQVTQYGLEFVGTVVKRAVEKLGWSNEPGVQKMIYLVGNETADQGQESYRDVIPKVREQGIHVSALYCPTFMLSMAPRQSAPPSRISLTSNTLDSSARALRIAGAELNPKLTWVEAAKLGDGQFLQLNYESGESPILSWSPEEFMAALDYMQSPQFRSELANERAFSRLNQAAEQMRVNALLRSSGAAGGRSPFSRNPIVRRP